MEETFYDICRNWSVQSAPYIFVNIVVIICYCIHKYQDTNRHAEEIVSIMHNYE